MMTPSRPNTPEPPSLRALPDEHAHLRRALDNARADARMWEAQAKAAQANTAYWRKQLLWAYGLNAVAWFAWFAWHTWTTAGGR